MTAPVDPSEKFAAYAHPERLVSTEWLQEQLDAGAGAPDLVVVESDEDVLLY
jgi:thiosulfate/3-mercaptopyruvate sulfurtransferase